MSVNQLANALGITATRLNDVVRGRRGITGNTALRLARYLRPRLNSGWVSNLNTTSARRSKSGSEISRKRFDRGLQEFLRHVAESAGL
jgi:plasmid maintenance system antidote protein VapI